VTSPQNKKRGLPHAYKKSGILYVTHYSGILILGLFLTSTESMVFK